jgi:hypothetical protein
MKMKKILAIATLLTLALTGCATQSGSSHKEPFYDVQPGGLPRGWLGGVTGAGQAKWTVVVEGHSAPVAEGDLLDMDMLQQSGVAKFCWCVKTNLSLRDGFVEVEFKPVSGKEDQAGGLIWRWQDGDNYYVARANALEDNVTIYHTVHGVRTEKGSASFKVATGEWHDLRVDFHGPHFSVTFDGQPALTWDDETFKDSGAVGVWTKADSVTQFRKFRWGK